MADPPVPGLSGAVDRADVPLVWADMDLRNGNERTADHPMKYLILLAAIVIALPLACHPTTTPTALPEPMSFTEALRTPIKRGQLAVWVRNEDTGWQWVAANAKAERLGHPRPGN